MNNFKGFIAILCFFISGIVANAQQPAFPGAEGYGRVASGGRGNGNTGHVVAVTNLLDDVDNPPEGSFRWALKEGAVDTITMSDKTYIVKWPLTIVFKVGGVINLQGELRSDRPNLTIAGQTAPGDGICFRGGTLNFSGSENVIVRYIRSRPGDELGQETSAFRIENGGNFIIDHCSFSWAIEETTHFSSNENTTVQWCIISESLYNSIHKKGARGYATQWGGEYASYHHNLLAHHNSRMPRINGSNENDYEALVDYRNNVNFNWGSYGAFYGGEWEGTNGYGFCATNVVNNYFKTGPATSGSIFARPSLNRSGVELDGYADWYFNGNIMEGEPDKTDDNWLGVDGSEVGSIENIRVDDVTCKTKNIEGAIGELENYDAYTETADEVLESVLSNAGATLPVRDKIDERVIAEVRGDISIVRYEYEIDGQITPIKGISSGLIDTQQNLVPDDAPEGTTAWDMYETTLPDQATVDTDGDGIPDDWENEKGLNPGDKADGRLIDASGYSYLEIYLADLTGYTIPFTVAVEDVDQAVDYGFSVYPQPVKEEMIFIAKHPINKIEMYDICGHKVDEFLVNGLNGRFPAASLSRGLYVAKAVFINGDTSIRKVIKQ
jgi:hypothetical protein